MEEANFARIQGNIARQQAKIAELGYYAKAGESLLRIGTGSSADNTLLDADLQIIEDGDGTDSCLQLSTDSLLIKNATGTDDVSVQMSVRYHINI